MEKKEKIHLFQKVMGIYMTDILIVSKDEESPWEYDDEVECTEVELREFKIEKWMPVEKNRKLISFWRKNELR